MYEIFTNILMQLRGSWRYRWHALLLAWALCGLGWMAVYSLPDTYQVRARFYVSTATVLEPLLDGLMVNTDALNRVNMMTKTLLSRPQLERAARVIPPVHSCSRAGAPDAGSQPAH